MSIGTAKAYDRQMDGWHSLARREGTIDRFEGKNSRLGNSAAQHRHPCTCILCSNLSRGEKGYVVQRETHQVLSRAWKDSAGSLGTSWKAGGVDKEKLPSQPPAALLPAIRPCFHRARSAKARWRHAYSVGGSRSLGSIMLALRRTPRKGKCFGCYPVV